MGKRVNLTLSDSDSYALERWADVEGRSTANLAAFLVEIAVKQAENQSKVPPPPKKKEER